MQKSTTIIHQLHIYFEESRLLTKLKQALPDISFKNGHVFQKKEQ